MTEDIKQRLQELRNEFDTGQRMMADLNARQSELHASLLRISGAIQVLEELLAHERAPAAADSPGERAVSLARAT